jgi:hypothetical protein
LYTSCVLWVAPLCAFYIYFDLSKKIKQIYGANYCEKLSSYLFSLGNEKSNEEEKKSLNTKVKRKKMKEMEGKHKTRESKTKQKGPQ